MKWTCLIPATLMACLALPALAADHARPDFAVLDSDGDGRITQSEAQALGDARFQRADADGDGVLSRAELVSQIKSRDEARIGRKADRMIERLDADGDGSLSREEMGNGRAARIFERADQDRDGTISQEEFARLREMRQHHKGKGGHYHERGGFGAPRD